jgi:tetratricopeptide (TPR) repeat protein
VDWAALSAFEAPALLALTLRGEAAAGAAVPAPLAEATAAYRAGRFREATDAFTRALESSDLTPPVAFYRGVSRLKTGSVESGLGDLEAAIASGEAPYAVEAHLYVAYGRLLLHDAGRADEALARYVDLEGDFAAEARRLRQQVGRVAQRPR